MIEFLDNIDRELMLWLNYDGGALMDRLWWIVSGKFSWMPLYLYLVWILIDRCRPVKIRWKELSLLIVLTAIVVLISDQIASGIIKPLVMRPRPARPDSGISDLIHLVNNYRGGHYGFVSSHAANTWGIALWFILLFNRQKSKVLIGVLIAFVLLNCYSRIYLGVHYPGDILGGLLVGTFSALFVFFVLLPLGNRWISSTKTTHNTQLKAHNRPHYPTD